MTNYWEILSFKNIGGYEFSNAYDWDTFIFFIGTKPTQKELNSYITEFNLNKCKDQAKILIASSDWSVLPDVPLENKTDFENYRSILRNLILNPVENPIFPDEPQPLWTTKI